MNALYSLYDALVSINVPTDKARAVVDAMERDMAAILASKSDVELLRQDVEGVRLAAKSDIELLRQDLEGVRLAAKSDIELLRQDVEGVRLANKSDIELLRKDVEGVRLAAKSDIELLRASMTIRLGSILLGALRWVIH
jgi:HEAT repeat protein